MGGFKNIMTGSLAFSLFFQFITAIMAERKAQSGMVYQAYPTVGLLDRDSLISECAANDLGQDTDFPELRYYTLLAAVVMEWSEGKVYTAWARNTPFQVPLHTADVHEAMGSIRPELKICEQNLLRAFDAQHAVSQFTKFGSVAPWLTYLVDAYKRENSIVSHEALTASDWDAVGGLAFPEDGRFERAQKVNAVVARQETLALELMCLNQFYTMLWYSEMWAPFRETAFDVQARAMLLRTFLNTQVSVMHATTKVMEQEWHNWKWLAGSGNPKNELIVECTNYDVLPKEFLGAMEKALDEERRKMWFYSWWVWAAVLALFCLIPVTRFCRRKTKRGEALKIRVDPPPSWNKSYEYEQGAENQTQDITRVPSFRGASPSPRAAPRYEEVKQSLSSIHVQARVGEPGAGGEEPPPDPKWKPVSFEENRVHPNPNLVSARESDPNPVVSARESDPKPVVAARSTDNVVATKSKSEMREEREKVEEEKEQLKQELKQEVEAKVKEAVEDFAKQSKGKRERRRSRSSSSSSSSFFDPSKLNFGNRRGGGQEVAKAYLEGRQAGMVDVLSRDRGQDNGNCLFNAGRNCM